MDAEGFAADVVSNVTAAIDRRNVRESTAGDAVWASAGVEAERSSRTVRARNIEMTLH
jgi:hypothetical protein